MCLDHRRSSRAFLVSLALVGVFSRSKHMAQYTRWNLVLLLLHRVIGLPVQSVFLSSVTTLIGFQHGATNGTKRRLVESSGTSSIRFLAMDFLAHVVPVLLTGARMTASHRRIHPSHLLHAYTWFGLDYSLVAGGFDCVRQYGPYPWRRQVRSTAIVPLAVWVAWTMDATRQTWVSRISLLVASFYTREWYDINDSQRRNRPESASSSERVRQ